jgi:hypothetical protein
VKYSEKSLALTYIIGYVLVGLIELNVTPFCVEFFSFISNIVAVS